MKAETYYVGIHYPGCRVCWLAGYNYGCPERYYNFSFALKFKTREKAEEGIEKAKKTHPCRERNYEIFTLSDFTPGSILAIEAGCKCPIIDNGHGRGYMGQQGECPLHK